MNKDAETGRPAVLAAADAYLEGGFFFTELARRIAIRSESQRPGSGPELSAYLESEMTPAFRAMGFDVRRFDNPAGGGPVLLATRDEGPHLPTVLGYGHGDVILGQDDRWTKGSGPWTLVETDGLLYGRGVADNKGQHTINMAALRLVLQQRGSFGFNAKFIIETGEETGSPGLREIIEAHRGLFSADVFIASDGPRADPARPTLTLGARGAENFDLVVRFRDGAHHSGNWGGLIADPAIVLAHAIASLTTPGGQVLVDGWRPPEIPGSVRRALEGLEVSGGPGAPDIDPAWGEPGRTAAGKVYASNSFAVLAMITGDPDHPVNAINGEARAHCQLRYVAGTEPAGILPALRRHLDNHGFGAVEIRPAPDGNAAGFAASRTDPDDPWASFVAGSIERTHGAPPAIVPSMGGSICNDLFTDLLGLPAIWIPHSYAGCSQHAPDEHMPLEIARSALRIMTGLYWDIGARGGPQTDRRQTATGAPGQDA